MVKRHECLWSMCEQNTPSFVALRIPHTQIRAVSVITFLVVRISHKHTPSPTSIFPSIFTIKKQLYCVQMVSLVWLKDMCNFKYSVSVHVRETHSSPHEHQNSWQWREVSEWRTIQKPWTVFEERILYSKYPWDSFRNLSSPRIGNDASSVSHRISYYAALWRLQMIHSDLTCFPQTWHVSCVHALALRPMVMVGP